MSAVPPPRYRVVEDGRRLVVVDLWTEEGRPSRSPPSAAPPVPALGRVAALLAPTTQTRFDGSATLTTHFLYDANGPRTIALDPGAATTVKAARIGAGLAALGAVVLAFLSPVALVGLVILGGKLHKQIRGRVTAWLDRLTSGGG